MTIRELVNVTRPFVEAFVIYHGMDFVRLDVENEILMATVGSLTVDSADFLSGDNDEVYAYIRPVLSGFEKKDPKIRGELHAKIAAKLGILNWTELNDALAYLNDHFPAVQSDATT